MKRNNGSSLVNDRISIIDFLIVLSKNIKIVSSCLLGAFLATLLYIFIAMEDTYQSNSKIMSSFHSSPQSQAMGFASQLGINLSSIQPDRQKWVYKDILESRILAKVILKKKFNTIEFGGQRTLLEILTHDSNNEKLSKNELNTIGLNKFKSMISVDEDIRTNIFSITVTAKEPKLASELNTALINTLDQHQREYNKTKTNEAKVFIEGRIKETRKELDISEEKLRDFRTRNRRINNSPSLLIEEERLLRETTVLTGVFTTLKQQLENTKIEAVKDQDYVIIIDDPDIPLFTSGLSKKSLLASSLILGLMLGVIMSLVYEYYVIVKKDEKKNLKIINNHLKENLLRYFRLKSKTLK